MVGPAVAVKALLRMPLKRESVLETSRTPELRRVLKIPARLRALPAIKICRAGVRAHWSFHGR